ncbi:DUF1540 domain-containing protein [Bacillus taeanensis]|uniref:DUF1540 domain-containing protein n=1 Tax=Bacillus taeanensis TaxID=273032 RepID=A0A366XUD6_9BACI|nr:DUF1540 domain-containing protein [Bacillus taeanensis]RBW69178.1 DUF1540 domain-containing protein [Bacillus taeanensis]
MPNVEVSCSISNCAYNVDARLCGAEKIMIDMDQHANFHTEFSGELGREHVDEARKSEETCCKTFKPKK